MAFDMPPVARNSILAEEPQAGPSTSAGYRITIDVNPDGTFAVSKLPSLKDSPDKADRNSNEVMASTFEGAVKAAIQIYKDNPIGEEGQTQFEAGYGGRDTSSGMADVPRQRMHGGGMQ